MKAILVIEIPQHLLNSDKYYAEVNIKPQDRSRNWYEKTVEAELKPLPQKKDENVKLNSWELTGIYNAESRGYNKCIDEILGEE